MTIKTKLFLITIGLVVLVFVFYAGRRSSNQDAKVKAAKEEVKVAEAKAKLWQDSAVIHKSNWQKAEAMIPVMTKEIDSLKKRRMVNVINTTNLPVVKYKKTQLDSIWHLAFD